MDTSLSPKNDVASYSIAIFWQYHGHFWPDLSHSKSDFDGVKSKVDLLSYNKIKLAM